MPAYINLQSDIVAFSVIVAVILCMVYALRFALRSFSKDFDYVLLHTLGNDGPCSIFPNLQFYLHPAGFQIQGHGNRKPLRYYRLWNTRSFQD